MIVSSKHGPLGWTMSPATATATTTSTSTSTSTPFGGFGTDNPFRLSPRASRASVAVTTSWGCRGVAVLSLLLAACATAPAPRSYPVPSADELLAALRARQAAARGLNLETRTTSWLGGERVRGTVQMLVERGGNLRFEAEASLQGTVAALAVHDGVFVFVDHQKKTFRLGPATPNNVASLIRIPLPAEAVAAILLGDVFLPEEIKALDVGWDRGADVLHLQTPDGAQLWVSLRRPAPLLAAWDVVAVAGQPAFAAARWRVSYQDLQRIGGQSFPAFIRFAEMGRDFDDGVEIKVRDRIVNPSFPTDAFLLIPPPGYLPQAPGD